MRKRGKQSVTRLVMVGLMTAVLAVLSQIAVPLPLGVPLTLQTFAVALCGYVLGWRSGGLAVVVYILLGAVGVPVFTGFSGGFAILAGMTGGFIWGFLPMAVLCGLGKKLQRRWMQLLPGFLGFLLCHLIGVIQFVIVSHNGFWQSLLLASAPFLIKDMLSVAAACLAALLVGSRLRVARLTP